MSRNADEAAGLFEQGFNCAQAVACACGQEFGVFRSKCPKFVKDAAEILEEIQ